MHPRSIAIVVMLVSSLVANRAAAYADLSPSKTIQKTNKQLHSLLKRSDRSARLSTTVGGFLDFEELARRSLGKHWEKRTPAERSEFVAVLRDLIERNYVKQLRGNLDYQLEYRAERVEGDQAQVTTAVKVKKDGRTEEVEIEYKMHRTKRGWMVVDVITDDVSIVRNYRSQFNKIINRDSYEVLVKKMKDKLNTI